MCYKIQKWRRNHTLDACECNSDEISVLLFRTQSRAWWIDENRLTDVATTTSVTQSGWFISWHCTVQPRTRGWTSVGTGIVQLTVAQHSRLNVDNLTRWTFIHSEVLTDWSGNSTTMKRYRLYIYNTTLVSCRRICIIHCFSSTVRLSVCCALAIEFNSHMCSQSILYRPILHCV